MIVLNVTYKCKPGMREQFLDIIKKKGIDVACRAEAGNIKYDYYMADADADELFLLEKWKDADALTEHTKQTHYIRLGEFKPDYVTDTIVEKYEIKG